MKGELSKPLCPCFAAECEPWPMNFFFIVVLQPLCGVCLFFAQLCVLRRLRRARIEAEIEAADDAYRNMLICVETMFRVIAVFNGLKVLRPLLQEGGLVGYHGKYGYHVCLASLMLVFTTEDGCVTFMELYFSLFVWLTLLELFSGCQPRFMLASNQIFIGSVLIVTLAINMMNILNITCSQCRPHRHGDDAVDVFYFLKFKASSSNFALLNKMLLYVKAFFSVSLIFGSLIAIFLQSSKSIPYRTTVFLFLLTLLVVGGHRSLHNVPNVLNEFDISGRPLSGIAVSNVGVPTDTSIPIFIINWLFFWSETAAYIALTAGMSNFFKHFD